jgi:integrase/recombinase XerD
MISSEEEIIMKGRKKERLPWTPESQGVYTLQTIEKARAGNRPTLRLFADWLGEVRGLSPASITVRLWSARSFVDAVTAGAGATCARAFRSLTADGIEDFFVQYGKDHGMAARRSMRSAVRLFLKFAAFRGWVGWELADAVPSLLGYRFSSLPKGLSDEQLATMLGSPWEGSKCIRRDRAIVCLLVTYGVRREQVSALRLADIDWYERTIEFAAHKGGKAVHHVLTEAVAESLADYLRDERPISDSDHVFLRQRFPHLRLGPTAISTMVRSRMERCGLPPRGPHALRHAFATRLLRAGQPVKAIADLLGHRSLDAVAVYAKVDFARLFEAAVDWPEVTS